MEQKQRKPFSSLNKELKKIRNRQPSQAEIEKANDVFLPKIEKQRKIAAIEKTLNG